MIRLATVADAQSLADLAAATPGAPHWTATQYQHMLTTAATSHILWAAVLGETLIGFAALSIHPPQAELESIAVHPSHQGHGRGRTLLAQALQHAAGIGITQVQLEVRTSSPAQALYRQLGFVSNGRRPRYYTNPVEDAVLMQWTAPASPPSGNPLSGIIRTDYGS